MKKVKCFAPASVSNVACGFDIMGFAIENLGIITEAAINDNGEIRLIETTGINRSLPKEIDKNITLSTIKNILTEKGIESGVDVKINFQMPISSGLGSSAAAAVSAANAIDKLFDLNLSQEELLNYSLRGEYIASGSIHADNVAPSLFGGFVLIRGYDPIDIVQIPFPENFYCVLFYNNIEIKTWHARKILKPEIPLKDAIKQWGNAAGLIAGMFMKDFGLIKRSLVDHIIEKERAILIPYFYEIKNAAMEAGALGASISGSGPTIFAVADSMSKSENIKNAFEAFGKSKNLDYKIFVTKINQKGASFLE